MSKCKMIMLCAWIMVMLVVSSAFGDATADLLRAVQSEHVTARRVEKLIEAGADVNAKGEEGMTPLLFLLNKMHGEDAKRDKARLESVKILIKYGADVNAQDNFGMTPLMSAYHPEAVKILLKSGADVNAKTNYGTALMNASEGCSPVETINLLIKAGANVNDRDSGGRTALMKAAFSTKWIGASNKGYAEIAKVLIKSGANIHIRDENGKTALIHASSYVEYFAGPSDAINPEIVRLLIKAGANPNIKDEDGHTALDYAIEAGSEEVRKILQNAMKK